MIEIVTAALVTDGNILLGLRAAHKVFGGCWGLVGGHIEEGETQWSALRRELREEVGIEIVRGSFIKSQSIPAVSHRPAVMHVYSIHEWSGEPSIQNDEHTSLEWFPLLEAAKLTNLAHPEHAQLIAELSRIEA